MALGNEIWDTKSNQEAEGAVGATHRRVNISGSFNQPEAGDNLETAGHEDVEGADGETMEEASGETEFPLTEAQLMSLTRSMYAQGASYQEQNLQTRWTSAYNAFNNKHDSDSKYSSTRYRGRSRLYRPKTRATVRKKMAEAAASLFSTSDATQIVAADESDEIQAANAELISEMVKFRLSRASENASVPWFMVTMGAHLTTQLSGFCVSKQYWEYQTVNEGSDEVRTPMQLPLGPNGEMVTLGETVENVPRKKVLRDRPKVQLYPPEDCIRDPGAPWDDQVQGSAYFILRHPMSVDQAMTFISNANEKSRMTFIDITFDEMASKAGTAADINNSALIRRSREQGGTDRYTDHMVEKEFQQVWLHENFLRIQGTDYVYWTLEQDKLISDVIPVEEAYPEQGGARPISLGVASIEPFKIDPMAPVEAWRPMQQEMNDLVNLRLDTVKQTIAPLAKVKRGRSVDVRAIQNRTPDSVVYMQDMSDVEFDRPGDVGQSSYVEMERLNADFDDQAGNFSIGSVQTNRSLGDTVGGMRMMTSNANALGEFDLRIFVETWVEPTLRQLVKLIQFYETDANIIAISAKKAKAFQRMGVNQITDDILMSQVKVSVDVGIGASDPMMSLQKFDAAAKIAMGLLGPEVIKEIKRDAVIDEVFGKAGFKDASERFFNKGIEEDPRMQEAQQVIQKLMGGMEEAQKAIKDKQAERDTKVQVARINAVGGLAKQEMGHAATQQQSQMDYAQQQAMVPQQGAPIQQDQQPTLAGGGGVSTLLGLPETDVNTIVQPLAKMFLQGLQMIAMQVQQGQQQTAQIVADSSAALSQSVADALAQAQAQAAQSVQATAQDNQTLLQQLMASQEAIAQGQADMAERIAAAQEQTAQQIAAGQQETARAIAESNAAVVEAIQKPKMVIRDKSGAMTGVAPQH
jgi:hypothetical protein